MRWLDDFLDGHLVHLILLAPAVLFGLGVFLFSRRRPAWDRPPTASAAADRVTDDRAARPDPIPAANPSGVATGPTDPDDRLG